jgi:hypothetical protein
MKASAISLKKLMPFIMRIGMRLSRCGPMMMPAIMYPLTFGSLSSFVIRVIRKPASKSMAKDKRIAVPSGNFSSMQSNIFWNMPFLYINQKHTARKRYETIICFK